MTLRFVQTVQNIVQPKVYHVPNCETMLVPTRRETIAELLERADHPLTAQEICEMLDIKKRSIVYEDIDHISKSVKRENKELLIRPSICGKCQFVFKVGKSVKEPSKCPKCKSQWILAPAFVIRYRKK